jgi:hypothetical protein
MKRKSAMSIRLSSLALLALALTPTACAPSPERVCDGLCVQAADCYQADLDLDQCVDGCVEGWAEEEDAQEVDCYDAELRLTGCVSELSCSELETYWDYLPTDPESYPCKDEDQEIVDACSGGDSCDCSVVTRDCTYTYDSLGNPTEHCTCTPSCCC